MDIKEIVAYRLHNKTRVVMTKEKVVQYVQDFSLTDFLHLEGNDSEALLYTVLFMPPLLEMDGSVLLNLNPISETGDHAKEFFEAKQDKVGKALEKLEFNFNWMINSSSAMYLSLSYSIVVCILPVSSLIAHSAAYLDVEQIRNTVRREPYPDHTF